jgi:protein tyrosine phosphatase
MKPFFEAVQKEEIGLIVDLRTEGSSSIFRDYTDPKILPRVGPDISGDKDRTPIAEGISSRALSIDGHRVIHLRHTNMADNTALSDEKFVEFMRAIDSLKDKGVDTSKIVFHCNGGLGRAPTMLVIRTLWQAAQTAKLSGLDVVYDAKNQNLMQVEGNLNLAAVLKNILCQGTYARSTFIQTKEQFEATAKFAEYLADNSDEVINSQG